MVSLLRVILTQIWATYFTSAKTENPTRQHLGSSIRAADFTVRSQTTGGTVEFLSLISMPHKILAPVTYQKGLRNSLLQIYKHEQWLQLETLFTLCNLKLSPGIPKSREKVQFYPGLCTEIDFQVLSFILHGWKCCHQHFRVLFIFFIFTKFLQWNNKQNVFR